MGGQPTATEEVSESPFRGVSPMQMNGASREQHALREHSFIQNTDTRLDEFIAQGRALLDDLVDQRNVLTGTQRRLLDAANTLGLSRDVIGWIEKRRYAWQCFSSLPVFNSGFYILARKTCISSSPVPSSHSFVSS